MKRFHMGRSILFLAIFVIGLSLVISNIAALLGNLSRPLAVSETASLLVWNGGLIGFGFWLIRYGARKRRKMTSVKQIVE
jgi:hypothetical protein